MWYEHGVQPLTLADSTESTVFQQTSGQQETFSVTKTPSHMRGAVNSQCPIQNAHGNMQKLFQNSCVVEE